MHPVAALLLVQTVLGPVGARRDTLPPSSTSPQEGPPRARAALSAATLETPDSARNAWRAVAARAQATQPEWVTPVVTQTARLKEEYRFDVSSQDGPGAQRTLNYGSGKGLELIPAERVEVSLLPPPYLAHVGSATRDGFGDVAVGVRFRIAAAPAAAGDYVVTLIATGTLPTANGSNGSPVATLTPTLAFGKGWGRVDIQGGVGALLPAGDVASLGRPVAVNAALQYRASRYLWPDCELNTTFFEGGANANKVQAFMTPGIVVGRFGLGRRLSAVAGVGEQIAISPYHKYSHNLIVSVRFPF